MFCKYCNAKMEDNAKFCASCGAVASASDEKVEMKVKPRDIDSLNRDASDYSYNKGLNYYSSDNMLMNHDSYQSDIYTQADRSHYVQKPIVYTENIGNLGADEKQAMMNRSNNASLNYAKSQGRGIGTKIFIAILGLAIGIAAGIAVYYFIIK